MGKHGAKKSEPPLKTLLTNRLIVLMSHTQVGEKKSESPIAKRIGMVPRTKLHDQEQPGKENACSGRVEDRDTIEARAPLPP